MHMQRPFISSGEVRVTLSSNTDSPVTVALDLRLASYRTGGIARYAEELQAALSALPDISVIPLRSRSERAPRLLTPPHHRLEQRSIPVELAFRRIRFDVYHAPDFIAPRLRKPVVATVHDLAFASWPGDLDPAARRYYEQLRQSRNWTAAWIVPSQWTAGELANRYDIDPSTIHVIPHGESLGLMDLPVVPRDERHPYLLAVGTVEPRKRYNLLIDAMQQRPGGPRIVIAGHRGWQSDQLERRLRSTPGIEWIDDADDERLRTLYRYATALVVPSRAEGFGLPVLEAMAAGTPVLSSGGGALREVTGDAAQLVFGDSWNAWADAMADIAGNPDRWESLSIAGRERAARYRWETAAEQTARVYRALARR